MKIDNPAAFNFIMQDDLYLLKDDKSLYMETAPQPIIETPLVRFNYLGGNKKKFVVVTHYPELEHIADAHLTALQSIFKRMELGMDDVAIFNRANYPETTFADLISFFEPTKLLLLGAQTLPAEHKTLILNKAAIVNNCNTLFSFSFDEMMDNTENKKAFWEQLKQL